MLTEALNYYDQSIPLVFLPPGEKGPKYLDWQSKTFTRQEIQSHYERNPDGNIGINLTGGDIVAVDPDSPEQEKVYQELFGDIVTWEFKSPHGGQRFFRVDKSRLTILDTAVYTYRGLGIRLGLNGKGAQSVLPPSITDDQARYWVNDPKDCPIADLPEEIYGLLLADYQAKQVCEKQTTSTDKEFLGSNSPGDDFCRRATWAEILEPYGWTLVGTDGVVEHWKRPDKIKGSISATTYCKSYQGRGLFYCFTDNAPPLEPNQSYSKFALFAFLNYGGDFKMATADLLAKGYGERTPEAILVSCGANKGEGGLYTFDTYAQAKIAAKQLEIDLPELPEREINFRLHGNELVAVAKRIDGEKHAGWARNRNTLSKSFTLKQSSDAEIKWDETVRHIVAESEDGGTYQDGGFVYGVHNGKFAECSPSAVRQVLVKHGVGRVATDIVIGGILENPFYETNLPFQPEYGDNREWNRYGAKLLYDPLKNYDAKIHATTFYDHVFDHSGIGLDDAVESNEWCKLNNIRTGGDFLRWWVASMLQQPKVHLPYLFLCSEGDNGQETGKSTLHKAIDLLFRKGSVDAEKALNENFNRQLAGAVFVFIEEFALNQSSYPRVKKLIDASYHNIRAMNTDAYKLPNYAHLIHSGNHWSDCPIELGDKRIIFIEATPLNVIQLNWDLRLKPLLEKEAPAFLAKLMQIPIKETGGTDRLWMPVLMTPAKKFAFQRLRDKMTDPQILQTAINGLFTETANTWKGNMSKLIEKLGPSNGAWSSSAIPLSKQIHKIKDDLGKIGITYTKDTKTRVYTFTRQSTNTTGENI